MVSFLQSSSLVIANEFVIDDLKIDPEIMESAQQAASSFDKKVHDNEHNPDEEQNRKQAHDQSISDYRKTVEKLGKAFDKKREVLVNDGTMKELMDKTINNVRWQAEHSRYKEQILSTVKNRPENSSTSFSGDSDAKPQPTTRPLVFVSSSMPIEILRHYARDLEKVGGVMLLRGMVGQGDRMKPTVEFVKEVIVKEQGCMKATCENYNVEILVDPVLFNTYDVTRVPALTIDEAFVYTTYCERGDREGDKAVVYGDSSLEGLLHEYERLIKPQKVKEIKQWKSILRS